MISRREWLRVSLSLGAGASFGGLLAGCAIAATDGHAATFEVTPTGALVSVHDPRAREAALVVLEAGSTGERVHGPVALEPGRGHTAVIELAGLAPDTEYAYAVRFDGALTGWYALRTAPLPESARDVAFLVSADIDVDDLWDSPILESMSRSGAAFFVSLGDWPYADNAPGAVTVDEYRRRHVEARAAAKVQALLAAMPAYAIYDDHEVRNDWDARFREVERDRIASALAVWDEFFPLRPAPGRYRSWRWGRHVELFLLDTRLYRSRNDAPDGPDKTMLGAAQRAWLMSGLAASTASFKIVLTSVPLDFGWGTDHWASFAWERDALFAAIAERGITGVLFVSADQHWFAAHRHASGAREFQVGPLARGIPELPRPAAGVLARTAVYNYGEVRIGHGSPPVLTFTARDANGDEIYSEAFSPSDLVLAG